MSLNIVRRRKNVEDKKETSSIETKTTSIVRAKKEEVKPEVMSNENGAFSGSIIRTQKNSIIPKVEHDLEVLEDLEKISRESHYSRKEIEEKTGKFDLTLGKKLDYDLDQIVFDIGRDNEESPLLAFIRSDNVLIEQITLKTMDYLVKTYNLPEKTIRNLRTFPQIFELAFQMNFNKFKFESENEIREGMIRLVNQRGDVGSSDMISFLYDKESSGLSSGVEIRKYPGIVYVVSEPEEQIDSKEQLIQHLLNELRRLGEEI